MLASEIYVGLELKVEIAGDMAMTFQLIKAVDYEQN